MFGIHVKIFNNDEWEAAKVGLAAAGKAEVKSVESNTMKFLATLESEFPDVYADIQKGIADYKDSSLSGGEKAVKVATDVLATVPDVLTKLSGIKAALVAGVTVLYSDVVADFKGLVKEDVNKL